MVHGFRSYYNARLTTLSLVWQAANKDWQAVNLDSVWGLTNKSKNKNTRASDVRNGQAWTNGTVGNIHSIFVDIQVFF